MTCLKILSFPPESLPPPSLLAMKSIPSHLRSTPLQAPRILTLSHCTTIDRIFAREKAYLQQKQTICTSAYTTIDLLALQDGTSAGTLSNPTHGTVFADDRVESHYDSLASALTHIVPCHIVPLGPGLSTQLLLKS